MHSPANLRSRPAAAKGTNRSGTGPILTSGSLHHLTLEANPSYWGTAALTPTLVMRPIVEGAARFLELQAGAVDIINNLGTDDFAVAEADPNVQILSRPPLNIGYLWMNRDVEKFSDVKVRQAVGMCLDREAIVQAFYPPSSIVAEQFMPPGMLGYTEGLTWYPRDVEAAQALLARPLATTGRHPEPARGLPWLPARAEQGWREAIQAQLADVRLNVPLDVIVRAFFGRPRRHSRWVSAKAGWPTTLTHQLLDFHSWVWAGDSRRYFRRYDSWPRRHLSIRPMRQPLYDSTPCLKSMHHCSDATRFAMAASAAVEGMLASPLSSEVFSIVSKADADTIIYAKNGDAISVDCTDETDGESFEVCTQIFDGLLAFTPGTTDVEPALATEWVANEDATQWTFTLREGVTFSDGTPFNADAVVLNMVRQWDPEHPLHVGRTGEFYYFTAFFGGFRGQ